MKEYTQTVELKVKTEVARLGELTFRSCQTVGGKLWKYLQMPRRSVEKAVINYLRLERKP